MEEWHSSSPQPPRQTWGLRIVTDGRANELIPFELEYLDGTFEKRNPRIPTHPVTAKISLAGS